MRGKAFIAFTAVAASLALGAAACGGGGPDITVEKGLQVTGGLPIEGAFGEAPAAGFAEPAGGDAFTLFQQGVTTGITGQGFGSATIAADSATIQVFIERFPEERFPEPPPPVEEEPFEEPFPEGFPESEPFTEEDLEPIIDAFIEGGVAKDDIEVVISAGGGEFGPPGTAQVRVKVADPEGKLEPLVEAAREAADTVEGVSFFDVSVFYAVDDCGPLEQAALEAAIEDAEERAQLLAGALDKRLGDLVFATESVFSPFGLPPCDPSVFGFDELEFFGGEPLDRSQPAEVQVASNVTLTFAFE